MSLNVHSESAESQRTTIDDYSMIENKSQSLQKLNWSQLFRNITTVYRFLARWGEAAFRIWMAECFGAPSGNLQTPFCTKRASSARGTAACYTRIQWDTSTAGARGNPRWRPVTCTRWFHLSSGDRTRTWTWSRSALCRPSSWCDLDE